MLSNNVITGHQPSKLTITPDTSRYYHSGAKRAMESKLIGIKACPNRRQPSSHHSKRD